MKTLKQKWQTAKDYNLFGDALASEGTLTSEQVAEVDEFLRYYPVEVPNNHVTAWSYISAAVGTSTLILTGLDLISRLRR